MEKRKTLFLFLDLIFVIAFNSIFFLAKGFVHEASVWACYIFLHFAYIMLCIMPLFYSKGKSSYIMNSVLFSITTFYFIFELIFGIIGIFITILNLKLVLIIQIISTAIYLFILLANLIANDSTEHS